MIIVYIFELLLKRNVFKPDSSVQKRFMLFLVPVQLYGVRFNPRSFQRYNMLVCEKADRSTYATWDDRQLGVTCTPHTCIQCLPNLVHFTL